MSQRRKRLQNAKRIVVKVGTSTITHENGKLNLLRLNKLVFVLSELMNAGKEIVLVSSGAISAGKSRMNLQDVNLSMGMKQAAASVGQCELVNIYSKLFSEYGYTVGQVLLTAKEVEDDNILNNIKNTFTQLINYKVLPIVNENDTVSVEEIKSMDNFTDNDMLSCIVAELIEAEALVILTDIDGFYNGNPAKNTDSKRIPIVEKISNEHLKYAGDSESNRGRGGMTTKLMAAEKGMEKGIDIVLVNGENPNSIINALNGDDIGTFFPGITE